MITVHILNPEWTRTVEADAVWLPGAMGQFEVLRNHAPIISTLTAGEIRWRAGETEESLPIRGGAVILKDNEMKVCVE